MSRKVKIGGWKTKLAAAGAILSGLGVVIAGLTGEAVDVDQIAAGAVTICGGLGVLGLGHKVEKLKALFEGILAEPECEKKEE